MARKQKTIAIIGGGPAGSATAIALLDTLQHERDRFKVCVFYRPKARGWYIGETIPPAATRVLQELGVAQILNTRRHCECSGSLAVWGKEEAVANDFMLDISGTGFHLNRTAFDADLLREAQSRGAHIFNGYSLRSAAETTHGFTLGFITTGENTSFHADFVVDASGQGASFARRLGIARNVIDEVISIHTRVPLASAPFPNHTLLEATAQGWWYLSRVPGDQCIISLTTDKQFIADHNLLHGEGWHNAYQATHWVSQFLPPQHIVKYELHKATACSAILSVCIGRRWLAVGDAASSYDSITSAGITKSLMQARLAGNAIADFFLRNHTRSIEQYQDDVFDQFNHYLGLRHHLYQREQRFPDAGFWQRRLAIS